MCISWGSFSTLIPRGGVTTDRNDSTFQFSKIFFFGFKKFKWSGFEIWKFEMKAILDTSMILSVNPNRKCGNAKYCLDQRLSSL